jgi:hypothetical protein
MEICSDAVFKELAREARLAAARRAHPDLSEAECQKIVAREFARARTKSYRVF